MEYGVHLHSAFMTLADYTKKVVSEVMVSSV